MTQALSNLEFARHMQGRRLAPLHPIPEGARVWEGSVMLKDVETGDLYYRQHRDDIARSIVGSMGHGSREDPGHVLKVHTYVLAGGEQRTMVSYFPCSSGLSQDFSVMPFVRGPESVQTRRRPEDCIICRNVDIPDGEECAVCGREGE